MNQDFQEQLKLIVEHSLYESETPGAAFAVYMNAYSNIGYLLLRCVIEAVTGLSIKHFLQQVIFEPLGLQETFVPSTLNDVRELTPGYSNFFRENQLLEKFYGWQRKALKEGLPP